MTETADQMWDNFTEGERADYLSNVMDLSEDLAEQTAKLKFHELPDILQRSFQEGYPNRGLR